MAEHADHPLMKRLANKGWSDEELRHAQKIFFSEEARSSEPTIHFNRLMFWMIFAVMIIGNLIISVAFIPLYLTISQWAILVVLGVIGLSFGGLFNVMIKDLDYIDPKHHVFGLILLPAIAVADIFLILWFVNQYVSPEQGIFFQQSPTPLSVVYVVAFLLPYFLRVTIEKIRG